MKINKGNIRNLTLLMGSTTLVLVTAGLAPALPGMALAFKNVHNADLLVRLTLTMPALLGIFGALFSGFLLDRLGRKPVIVTALLLYALVGTVGYTLDSLYAILLSRAILGLAMAGLANGFVTLLTDYFTGPRLNQFSGYFGAFAGFSGVVYQLLAGNLASFGWRHPFLLYLIALLILLGVLFAVDEPKIKAQPDHHTQPNVRVDIPLPTILMIYAIGLVSMVTLFTLILYIPFHLTAHVAATPRQVGLALAFLSLPGGIIALQYFRFKAWFSYRFIAGIVFLNLGISNLIALLSSSYSIVVAGLFVGGIGFGSLMPNLISWLASKTPPAVRGRAVGGLNATVFLGQFITPLITQPVVDRAGVKDTFGLVGGISILLAILVIGGSIKGVFKLDQV